MSLQKVLIVDDDQDFVEVVAGFLETNGFTALRAYNGAEGVRVAKADQPDLILMDIMMNERTEGFFAIQEIRRTPELAHVPIFVVSALCGQLPDVQIPEGGNWLSHDTFLPKPVDMGHLLEKIRQRIGAAV